MQICEVFVAVVVAVAFKLPNEAHTKDEQIATWYMIPWIIIHLHSA